MAKDLTGLAAWVTGGGTGIGKALALELAGRGAAVAISGRRRDRLDEVAALISAGGGQVLVLPLDVTDEAATVAAVKAVVAAFGKLDIAIANAGFGASGRLVSVPVETWRKQMDVNVIGVVCTAKAAIPELEKTGGRLGLVASVMGFLTMVGQGPYAASKFAVRAIGLTLSQELHGTGVSCTTVHPGFVESEIAQVDARGEHDPSRKDPRPAKLMWSADKAAHSIVGAMMARKREHVFTGHGKVGAFLGKHFPGIIHFAMTRKGVRKKAQAAAKSQG
ncbi:MAG: SDR family NAD(P)-dependent oxidoreductase [Myxococcota bacterium]